MWPLVFTVYLSLPLFQQARLGEMGFGLLFSVTPFWQDTVLLEGLKELWDGRWNAFALPWGHMTPNLEDVARITGLKVDGEPVTGQTPGDCWEMGEWLLGYEHDDTRPLRSLKGSVLTDLLGVKGMAKGKTESMDAYAERMRETLTGRWTQESGLRADQELRVFLLFFLSRLLFATKASKISLRYLSLLEDLSAVGSYAWGAAVLAELFLGLSSPGKETGISGFTPL